MTQLLGFYSCNINPDLCTIGISETTIPSESSILAAKAKRDRLRNVKHPDDDFISLSLTGQGGEYQGPHPESRLVREEDELGEGDDGMPHQRHLNELATDKYFRICGLYERTGTDRPWKEV